MLSNSVIRERTISSVRSVLPLETTSTSLTSMPSSLWSYIERMDLSMMPSSL